MAKPLLLINDYLAAGVSWELPSRYELTRRSLRDGIPDAETLRGYDTVLVLGRLEDPTAALQFGGALRLAVESGLTAVLLYPVVLEGPDRRLLEQLFPSVPGVTNYGSEWTVAATTQAFHEFFAVYGRSKTHIQMPSDQAEVLGRIESEPCALTVLQGSGRAYVLPFRAADISTHPSSMVREFLKAMDAHLEGEVEDQLPEFLESLRLPGESEILSEIEKKEGELKSLQVEAERLQRYRHLVGTATGSSLESLIIDALNVILAETDVRAEDREDVGAEDFWLVGSDGDLALAEAKGVGGHVRRANVNQVDDHRDSHDLEPEATPGILIVNVFRNTSGEDAVQRQLPVNRDVVAHAARNNVLVLRTRDLFYLLHRKMAGEGAGQELLAALEAGGGWLEVSEDAAELRS